jgi:hypothetical protein
MTESTWIEARPVNSIVRRQLDHSLKCCDAL